MRMMMMAALAVVATPVAAQDVSIAEAVANVEARSESNVAMDENRHPTQMLDFLGLKAGMDVLDIAGANLYWAEIMAPVVGDTGSIVIWSPNQFYSDEAKARLAEFSARNPRVVGINSEFETPMLGTNRYDFLLINLDYHDAYWESERFGIERMEPRAWAKRLYDALEPGGVMGLADHSAKPGADPRASVEAAHRIDPAVVRADMEAVGFVFEADSDLLANADDDLETNVFDPAIRGKTDRFLMRFRKPE
ncbi:class I SAM-dependent methyltransferase [Sphingomicrobium clamense]|uniref:Methyltransferase n=1 Tax=Sphingomicrobium clamense TaxID=2851013 RepID=A0ABS6V614_9SPHN|nr:methyltransferase [Sphingomicrobium sp. B8]MBW0144637.1 methyltransferase [Sphingomicrobium sp. B8]